MNYKVLCELIRKYDAFILTTHINPDADGLGAAAAFTWAMRSLGKFVELHFEEEIDKKFHCIMPNLSEPLEHPSKILGIVFDTNTLERTGPRTAKYLLEQCHQYLFIDHHPIQGETLEHHFVDTQRSATAEMVATLITELDLIMTKDMALPLFAAILIDTNLFRYPTVTSQTHRLVATLLETGINTQIAYDLFYGTRKLRHLHLLGHILMNAKLSDGHKIAWLEISEEDFAHYESELEDTHGYINHLLVLESVEVVCMFRHINQHIKISFRSRGANDVGMLAQFFGGGGHSHSAAVQLPMAQVEPIAQFVNTLETYLTKLPVKPKEK
jgi:phosphoesterase RecJ-like protein